MAETQKIPVHRNWTQSEIDELQRELGATHIELREADNKLDLAKAEYKQTATPLKQKIKDTVSALKAGG